MSLLTHTIQTRLQQELPTHPQLQQAKQAMAERLTSLIQQAYLLKAAGGTDETGERWEPTKKFMRQGGLMLIASGTLFNSFTWETTAHGFRIINNTTYGPKQFRDRHPVPRQIPDAWIEQLISVAQPYLKNLIIDVIHSVVPNAAIR